ncbi:MAG: AAA family ATPase [Acidobacteriota bacterium]|nr:AAA family ATPase [Acidobacteriota bacterium]
MRVTEISVKGLFGVFDHVIPLNLEDKITIIHGPNGVGKTVLLRMLDALFNAHYATLHDFPFTEFSISFDDQSQIDVTHDFGLQLAFSKAGNEKELFLPMGDWQPQLSLFQETSSLSNLAHSPYHPEPAWLFDLQKTFSVILVETQRLLFFQKKGMVLRASNKELPLKVEKCAKELSNQIQSTLAESAEISQLLERTFPNRLVQKAFSPLPEADLRARLDKLEQEQARLSSVGLLTNGNGFEFKSTLPIDEQNINALSIYVQDAQQKLSVFDKLATKLSLFKKIVEQKFLYKKLNISKERGLAFFSPDGHIIPLSGLSSGEQHELVLLYELLFNTKAGSLILIDEPEISLHLAWQVNFLSDLQEICKLASLDVILATHSPEIIHDRWDLTVGLKGPGQ